MTSGKFFKDAHSGDGRGVMALCLVCAWKDSGNVRVGVVAVVWMMRMRGRAVRIACFYAFVFGGELHLDFRKGSDTSSRCDWSLDMLMRVLTYGDPRAVKTSIKQ